MKGSARSINNISYKLISGFVLKGTHMCLPIYLAGKKLHLKNFMANMKMH